MSHRRVNFLPSPRFTLPNLPGPTTANSSMTYLKIIILAFASCFAIQAWAFACLSYSDHNEIEISGLIGDTKIIKRCPADVVDASKPSFIFLSSPGGNIDQIPAFISDLQRVLSAAFKMSQVIP